MLRTLAYLSQDVQRRVLDASETLGHPIRRALERFGLELFHCPSAADSIPLPLVPPQEFDSAKETDVATDQFGAFALLELLKSTDGFEPTESAGAGNLREPLTALTAALRYAETWQCTDAPRGDPRQLDAVRAWAEIDPSMLAQLEWLLVARERGDAVRGSKSETRGRGASRNEGSRVLAHFCTTAGLPRRRIAIDPSALHFACSKICQSRDSRYPVVIRDEERQPSRKRRISLVRARRC
ncbi:MAG: hypothetical protein QM784_18335 [Polyangiaceae bacterium]